MASYSPVFSAQFIIYNEAAPNSSFLVPAGFTAVVRDAEFVTEAGESLFSLSLQNSDTAPEIQFAVIQEFGVLASASWHGRVVVPGGGTITLYQQTLGVDAQVYVGGYLLRNALS